MSYFQPLREQDDRLDLCTQSCAVSFRDWFWVLRLYDGILGGVTAKGSELWVQDLSDGRQHDPESVARSPTVNQGSRIAIRLACLETSYQQPLSLHVSRKTTYMLHVYKIDMLAIHCHSRLPALRLDERGLQGQVCCSYTRSPHPVRV